MLMRRARCILLLFLLLLTGRGLARTTRSGVNRLRGHFLPPPCSKGHRSTGWHTHPGALFYFHHLRSCAMSAWGASGAAGAGQLGCAADGCCLHGLLRWVHLLRASGTGILLLAAGSLLMPQWSTTPIAVLALGAKACNFHRPYRECQLRSRGCWCASGSHGWGNFLLSCGPGASPCFPRMWPWKWTPPIRLDIHPLPGPRKKNCGPFLGMTCQWSAWIRGRSHTCPVLGCFRHPGGNRPGWGAFGSLRAHVDQHLSGELPGARNVFCFSSMARLAS